jgi:hypothetical protein
VYLWTDNGKEENQVKGIIKRKLDQGGTNLSNTYQEKSFDNSGPEIGFPTFIIILETSFLDAPNDVT